MITFNEATEAAQVNQIDGICRNADGTRISGGIA